MAVVSEQVGGHGRALFGFTPALGQPRAMYDKARTKGNVVSFKLLGQGFGLCIKVK